ncbi:MULTISPECIES: hypothetical protein [Blautia]|uniref:hypothetical protein n=1 Tax=Blautia TaxID=572511 RepID=UPI000BA36C7B|nr:MULTISPECIES: hypothetical protein [Blautia]
MKLTTKHIITFLLFIVMALSFTACQGNDTMSDTFPNIKKDEIPDILEKSVGTIGNAFYTKGTSSEENDYDAYFSVIFNDTNEGDYNELIAHYKSTSTGTDEENMLLYDWGRLKVLSENESISVEAYIK